MPKHGKKYNAAAAKVERGTHYSPLAAMRLVKELSAAKFDETVEVSVRLGVDTRKADQNVRGSISLPNVPARAFASPSSPRAPRPRKPNPPVLTSWVPMTS